MGNQMKLIEVTAKEYFETKSRMTVNCKIDCEDCALGFAKNGTKITCANFQNEHYDEAIAIVQKWGEEHPVNTLLDKFFEVFPNAIKDENGLPEKFCPRQFGYKDSGCFLENSECVKCWSQPYAEVAK